MHEGFMLDADISSADGLRKAVQTRMPSTDVADRRCHFGECAVVAGRRNSAHCSAGLSVFDLTLQLTMGISCKCARRSRSSEPACPHS